MEKWVKDKGNALMHSSKTDKSQFSNLLYELFAFEPFCDYLEVDLNGRISESRPARNLSKLINVIAQYEENSQNYKYKFRIDRLFGAYLRYLYEEKIREYEDESEYAPSGYISFLTIHQSKGMEFPIVFVEPLNDYISNTQQERVFEKIETDYYKREEFEPKGKQATFDFWRKYYTAFSRAQNLLIVLDDNRPYYNKTLPNAVFDWVLDSLPNLDSPEFKLEKFSFSDVKPVNLKNSFSFTSHIEVYNACPRRYKFYKELGFPQIKILPMISGTVVHQTIEDIHKAVLRGEEETITKKQIVKWFDANYSTLSQREKIFVADKDLLSLQNQVFKYVERQSENWNAIKATEEDVSLITSDYIIKGTIDLIKGDKDTTEIVDFKTTKNLTMSFP